MTEKQMDIRTAAESAPVEFTPEQLIQFTQLFAIMRQLYELDPWATSGENDLFEIVHPNYKEPVICAVFTNNKEYRTLHVYADNMEFASYFRYQSLLDEEKRANVFRLNGLLQCINCRFSERKSLGDTETALLDAVHFEAKGKYAWPSFVRFRGELAPCAISVSDVQLLLDVLPQYIEAYKMCRQGILKPDFAANDLVLRSKKEGVWATRVRRHPEFDVPLVHFKPGEPTEETAKVLQKLREEAASSYVMEADAVRFYDWTQRTKDGENICSRLVLTANQTTGKPLNAYPLHADDKTGQGLVETVFACIDQYGKPEKLSVHDMWTEALLHDFCESVGVSLVVEGTPTIDASLLEREKR
jgi:hypothetical protein